MRIKPTTITIEEEPYTGVYRIQVSIQHDNGQSNCSTTVDHKREDWMRPKVDVIIDKIKEILNDYVLDGTYES